MSTALDNALRAAASRFTATHFPESKAKMQLLIRRAYLDGARIQRQHDGDHILPRGQCQSPAVDAPRDGWQ